MLLTPPECWRLESSENKEREQLESGGGGQHPGLVDALHLAGGRWSIMIHGESVEVHDYSEKGNECFFTTFHRSMASTQTLMKASRASARLEFSVLSLRGQLHVMGKSWS